MRRNISLTEDFSAKLEKKAKEAGMSISEYIRFALILLWKGKK